MSKEPISNKTLCQPPRPPDHGYISGHDYDYNGKVQVHCDPGYKLSGPSNLTCLPVPYHGAPGVWAPVDEYKCLLDTLCQPPMPPDNGFITGDNFNDGGVVQIHCETGYTLSGPSNLTCTPVPHPGAPGVWLPEDEYNCLPDRPNVIEIRTLGHNSNNIGPRYSVHNAGGPVETVSTPDETHHTKDTLPVTQELQCTKPEAPEHGKVIGTDFTLYSTVSFVCQEGYSLVGPDRITCLPVPDPFNHVAIWEPQTLPTCRANPPSTLPLVLVQSGTEAGVYKGLKHRLTDSVPNASQTEGVPSRCSLPKVVGPCRAAIPRFYFDTNAMECFPFNYGGCHGNDNNFETFNECQTACH